MADYYLDAKAYVTSGTGNGSTSGTSATLSIGGSPTGVIAVGAMISGAGIPADTFIVAVGTGNGGAGTYTMNRSLTLSPTDLTFSGGTPYPANAPTWGVPIEGDGSAKTAATASATVSIDLSSATAATGATFIVMGATLTCVSTGAIANQFNAGTGATLVANLVTAINRTTNTSVLAAQATGWSTPKIQDAVFARIGSPTTTLEIMTRAGSAQYNTSQVVTSGLTGGTFGPYTFSGGSGGCWGWLSNFARGILPSAASTTLGYGLWGDQTTPIPPMAGPVLVSGDVVKIRSNCTVFCYLTGTRTLNTGAVGTRSNPVVFEVDNGTQWPADGSTPVFRLAITQLSTAPLQITTPNTVVSRVLSTRYSPTSYGLEFDMTGTSGVGSTIGLASSYSGEFIGVKFAHTGDGGVNFDTYADSSTDSDLRLYKQCVFAHKSGRVYVAGAAGGNRHGYLLVEDSVFDNSGNASAHTGFFALSSQAPRHTYWFDSCTFTGFQPGSRLFVVGTTDARTSYIYFRNTSWGTDLSERGPNAPIWTNSIMGKGLFVSSQFGAREFLIDNAYAFIEWNALRSFPTLNATTLEGAPWSIHIIPTSQVGRCSRFQFGETPRIGKFNTLGAGVKTLTVELAIHKEVTWNKSHVSVVLDYIDPSGQVQVFDSFDWAGGALTPSAAAWSGTANDPADNQPRVPFVQGSTQWHNRYKFSIVTPTAVAANTEIGIVLRVHTNGDGLAHGVFFDPEVVVS